MGRPKGSKVNVRKDSTMEEMIQKQEEVVCKSKAKYDADVAKLKDLHAKRDEMRRKELLKAIEASGRTYEEIMTFLKEK